MKHGFGYFEEDALSTTGDLSIWRRIFGYTAGFRRLIALAVVFSLVISVATLALPYLVRLAMDTTIVNRELDLAGRLGNLSRLVLPFAGLAGLGFLAEFCQVALLEWTGQNVMHRMRQHLFSHLLSLDLAFFNANPVGKLVTRLTNDIQNMYEMFTSVIVTLFNDMVRIVGILAVLFWMNWRLALLMTLLIPAMVLYTVWFSRYAREVFRLIRTRLARINSYLQEALAGIGVIQLFQQTAESRRRFEVLNDSYLQETLTQIRIFAFFMPLIDVMNALAIGLIIWYGGGEIIRERMSLGVLVAFLSYMRLFFQPVRELSQKYSIVQSAMASAERIFQLLDERPVLKVQADWPVADKVKGEVEFVDVSFGYEAGSPVVKAINLQVRAGETLAVVGATGAGKTSLINLLERFYDPDEGAIRIDGADLRRVEPAWLRRQIGLVMQEVFIIPASFRDNILLGQETDEARLAGIINAAQLAELVARLPQGLETLIGEGGIDLSAGERQLLALARVLARDPRILVLDEATSSVDSQTEILIERALAAALANRTSIVIAHRLSTIKRADRIIVMDHGQIAEQGTHEGLMAREGLYFTLQRLQNGEGAKRSDKSDGSDQSDQSD